jgi:hypothetical protein
VGAVVVTAAVAVFALVAHRRNEKSHAPAKPAFTHLTPTGQPADWSKLAKVTATLPGRVHCFSMLDDDTVRVIWGAPRRVEDINIDTGARRVSSLVPEAYATGCPDLSPNRRELLFTANTTAGGNEIRHSVHPDGSEATPLTAGSDAVWLMNGEEFAFSIDSSHAAVFSLPTKRLRLLADPGLGGLQTILGKTASAHSEGLALMQRSAVGDRDLRRAGAQQDDDHHRARRTKSPVRSHGAAATPLHHGGTVSAGRV